MTSEALRVHIQDLEWGNVVPEDASLQIEGDYLVLEWPGGRIRLPAMLVDRIAEFWGWRR